MQTTYTAGEECRMRLPERIDSASARDFELVVRQAFADKPDGRLRMDACDLAYISSAGLRVLVRARKERDLVVENVSNEVYDIFEMTGLTDIMDVRRRMREVSVEGCELVGEGGNGTVWRLDEETIVKVYHGVSNTLDKIERDRRTSRSVLTHGIDTAIPYDVVRVGEDYGVVYEMVDAMTLGRYLMAHPDEVRERTSQMVALLRRLHGTHFAPGKLADARDLLYHRIDVCEGQGLLTADEAAAMHDFLGSLPERDTFVHNDFHPGNIMVSGGDLILIDVGDSGIGHPVLDLMGMWVIYVHTPRTNTSMRYCGVSEEVLRATWPQIISEYFDTENESEIERYQRAIDNIATLRIMLTVGVSPNVSQERRVRIVAEKKRLFFDNLDHMEIVG